MNVLHKLSSGKEQSHRFFYIVDFWDVSPHIETSLEIVSILSELGMRVSYSCLTYSTKVGNYSKTTDNEKVASRLKKIYSQIQNLPGVNIISSLPEVRGYKPLVQCPKYPSTASLLHLNTKKCMIGSSILASLSTGEPLSIYPYLHKKDHIKTIELMIDSYSEIYERIKLLLSEQPITDVIVCNGIHLHSNAVYSAACNSQRKITTHFHERGQRPDKFLITSKEPPHSMSKFLEDFKTYLVDTCKSTDRISIGRHSEEYFRSNIINSKHSASQLLNSKSLFNCMSNRSRTSNKYKVTLFTSSDAEQISCGPTCTLPGGWSSQIEFLVDFILAYKSCDNLKNLELNVRIHPNISSYHPNDLMRQANLFDSVSNCRLYLPDDPCDSYELATKSDIIISYGSTISLETSYLGIPSFVASPTPYELCGLVPRIYHIEQIRDIFNFPESKINEYNNPHISIFNAYCKFLDEREIKHKYYASESFSRGQFKNKYL